MEPAAVKVCNCLTVEYCNRQPGCILGRYIEPIQKPEQAWCWSCNRDVNICDMFLSAGICVYCQGK